MHQHTAATEVAAHRRLNAERWAANEPTERRLEAERLGLAYHTAKTPAAFAEATKQAADTARARRLELEARRAERQREELSYLSRPA